MTLDISGATRQCAGVPTRTSTTMTTVAAEVTTNEDAPQLRDARLAKGWPQQRLQEVAGVPQALISALESGRRARAGMKTWRRLSAALGVELYPGCGVPPSWYEFMSSPFAEGIDDETLGALVGIACSHPSWRRAPLRTWIALADVTRAALSIG